jgi:hypothetical protein
VRAVPRLCELYPGICLTTEGRARINLGQGRPNELHATDHACWWVASCNEYWHKQCRLLNRNQGDENKCEVENEFTITVLGMTLRLYIQCNWYDTKWNHIKMVGFPVNELKAFTTMMPSFVRNVRNLPWQLHLQHRLRHFGGKDKVYFSGIQYCLNYSRLWILYRYQCPVGVKMLEIPVLHLSYCIFMWRNASYIPFYIYEGCW